MGKSNSPTHQPQLLKMLEEECHNSFLKLPDEEPIHVWNTDEVEEHNQRMKKLDKKLAKYNDEISMLKEMLSQADEKAEVEIERYEQREQEARQEIVDLEEAAQSEALSTEVQYGQLKARLDANRYKITQLHNENKTLTKDLRKAEKQTDKIKFHNHQLEESSTSLLSSYSYSDLCLSKVFDENHVLSDTLEEGRETFEHLKTAAKATQDKYMVEAQDRLELQKGMAEILYAIQGAGTVQRNLANRCTQIGLEAQARSEQRIEQIDEQLQAQEALAALRKTLESNTP